MKKEKINYLGTVMVTALVVDDQGVETIERFIFQHLLRDEFRHTKVLEQLFIKKLSNKTSQGLKRIIFVDRLGATTIL